MEGYLSHSKYTSVGKDAYHTPVCIFSFDPNKDMISFSVNKWMNKDLIE